MISYGNGFALFVNCEGKRWLFKTWSDSIKKMKLTFGAAFTEGHSYSWCRKFGCNSPLISRRYFTMKHPGICDLRPVFGLRRFICQVGLASCETVSPSFLQSYPSSSSLGSFSTSSPSSSKPFVAFLHCLSAAATVVGGHHQLSSQPLQPGSMTQVLNNWTFGYKVK